MTDIRLLAKREGVAQGYALWIDSATGSRPNISRNANGINILMNEAQTKALSTSIIDSMDSKPSPDDLNVSMPWGEILLPVVLKQYGIHTFVFGAGLIGLGMFISRKRKR